jgi:spermidine synthase
MTINSGEKHNGASALEGEACPAGFDRSLSLIANRPAGWQAIDTAHVLLLAGLVASHKPNRVLELGIGSAYLSKVILSTLEANGAGSLMSVDNFFDWNHSKPLHIQELEEMSTSWRVVVEDETEFVKNAQNEEFDLVVSDGDHTRGYQNAVDVFRICQPGGYLVFHDTRSELFRLLARLPKQVSKLGFSSFHFTRQSRSDECTDRGLLVVCKDQKRRFRIDLKTRVYLMLRARLPAKLLETVKANFSA